MTAEYTAGGGSPGSWVGLEDGVNCRVMVDAKAVRLDRMVSGVEKVRERLLKASAKDRMHLRDLIDVGLVDDSWASTLPDVLAERLRTILEDPNG